MKIIKVQTKIGTLLDGISTTGISRERLGCDMELFPGDRPVGVLVRHKSKIELVPFGEISQVSFVEDMPQETKKLKAV